MRSWAAASSTSSGSAGSEPDFSSSICSIRRASRPAGVAADLLVAQRQLFDPVEQQGEALGAAEHAEHRVEPRGRRVVAQQPLAERLPGADPELFERPVEQLLDAAAQAARGGAGGREDEDPLGAGSLLDQAGEAAGEHLALAGPGLADQQQRAGAVADRPLLGLGESKHGPTLPGGRPP